MGVVIHFSKVFHQQPVDEDVSAANTAQEDDVDAVVEEWDEFPREEVIAGQEKAECIVPDQSRTSVA